MLNMFKRQVVQAEMRRELPEQSGAKRRGLPRIYWSDIAPRDEIRQRGERYIDIASVQAVGQAAIGTGQGDGERFGVVGRNSFREGNAEMEVVAAVPQRLRQQCLINRLCTAATAEQSGNGGGLSRSGIGCEADNGDGRMMIRPYGLCRGNLDQSFFDSELNLLKELASEFARANPALAPHLGGTGTDLDVERLLEAVAQNI